MAGWTYLPHTQYCYRFFQERKLWSQARNICSGFGAKGVNFATLATIHDDYTNKFLAQLIPPHILPTNSWVGG